MTAPRRLDRWWTAVATTAPVLFLLHVLDERLWHPPAGVSPENPGPTVAVAVAAFAVVLAVLRWSPPAARSLACLSVGALATTSGVMHLLHAIVQGPTGADVTGILAGVGGVALVLAALVGPFLHRRRPWRSVSAWVLRVCVGAIWLTVVLLVLLPAVVGVAQSHHPVVAPEAGQVPGSREVAFRSADGLLLRGHYLPSRNGAAVLLVSSARGDRSATVRHARLLAARGYGVLAYDARGSGQSQGTPNGYGWGWDLDVHGAVTFLEARTDVRSGRIGVLGLSTGADVALAAAASDHRIRAVVADGATGRTSADVAPSISDDPVGWIYARALFLSVEVWAGTTSPAPLVDLVDQISPTPVLYVATGSLPVELPANRRFAAATREPVTLWELPGVEHTQAVVEVPTRYDATVTGFLERALR